MRLLLDTHVLIALLEREPTRLGRSITRAFLAQHVLSSSVASLWEIAIKTRIGKLKLDIKLDLLEQSIGRLGLDLLPIQAKHVVEEVSPAPATRDPFDRLLLAQCVVEGMRLLTIDRALADHPFAYGG